MNQTQLPFLVEGILIVATMLVGFGLSRSGRPYGKVKLGIHLFLALWFSTGYGFIAYSLGAHHPAAIVWVPVFVMGLAILAQLGTGFAMLAADSAGRTLLKLHIVASVLLLVADAAAFVLTGLPAH